MTGFGGAVLEADGLSARVEVRAVNHRFLQVKSRVPAEHFGIEPLIEAEVRRVLSRGSVTVTVNLVRTDHSDRAAVDVELAARYRDLLRDMAERLGMQGDLGLRELIQLPGVVNVDTEAGAEDRERELVLGALKGALAELDQMRADEGLRMLEDLEKNAQAVAEILARVETRMPEVLRLHHEGLQRRLKELLVDRPPPSEVDLARELALLADRTDVSEEIARLRSHLEQLSAMLSKDGAVGRQLDFLIQEFLREANTIGSKCTDAEAAHHVVELKTHIERLREQAQNVE